MGSGKRHKLWQWKLQFGPWFLSKGYSKNPPRQLKTCWFMIWDDEISFKTPPKRTKITMNGFMFAANTAPIKCRTWSLCSRLRLSHWLWQWVYRGQDLEWLGLAPRRQVPGMNGKSTVKMVTSVLTRFLKMEEMNKGGAFSNFSRAFSEMMVWRKTNIYIFWFEQIAWVTYSCAEYLFDFVCL